MAQLLEARKELLQVALQADDAVAEACLEEVGLGDAESFRGVTDAQARFSFLQVSPA